MIGIVAGSTVVSALRSVVAIRTAELDCFVARSARNDALHELEDRILFVDGEAIVIDKPAGLPVDAPARGGDSIEARIDELKLGFQRPPVADAPARPGHVGLPAVRAQSEGAGALPAGVRKRARSRKTIWPWSTANRRGEEGTIDLPLAKVSSAEGGWRMVADRRRKAAATRWRRIAAADGQTLVEFRPLPAEPTRSASMPRAGSARAIVGDPVYSCRRCRAGAMTLPDSGMLLHASRLIVPREPGKPIDVTAPVPERFGRWLDLSMKPEDVTSPRTR